MNNALPLSIFLAPKLVAVLLFCVWIPIWAAIIVNNRQTARNRRAFLASMIALGTCSSACIVSAHLFTSLIFAHLSVWIALYLVARWAQRGKGSIILSTGTLFLCLDSAALFCLALGKSQQLATIILVLLAAFARLMVPFVSWWFRLLDRVSPIFISIVFVGPIASCGTVLALKAKLLMPISSVDLFAMSSVLLMATTSLFMGLLNLLWHRKDFVFFTVSFFALYAPAFFFTQSPELFTSLVAALVLAISFNLAIYNRLDRNKQYTSQSFLLCFSLLFAIPGLGIGMPFWMSMRAWLFALAATEHAFLLYGILATWLLAFLCFFVVSTQMSTLLPEMEKMQPATQVISWQKFAALFLCLITTIWLITWWTHDGIQPFGL